MSKNDSTFVSNNVQHTSLLEVTVCIIKVLLLFPG